MPQSGETAGRPLDPSQLHTARKAFDALSGVCKQLFEVAADIGAGLDSDEMVLAEFRRECERLADLVVEMDEVADVARQRVGEELRESFWEGFVRALAFAERTDLLLAFPQAELAAALIEADTCRGGPIPPPA